MVSGLSSGAGEQVQPRDAIFAVREPSPLTEIQKQALVHDYHRNPRTDELLDLPSLGYTGTVEGKQYGLAESCASPFES